MAESFITLTQALGITPAAAASVGAALDLAEEGSTSRRRLALIDLAKIERDAEKARKHIVQAMRVDGMTWAEVANFLGISGAAAHKRYGADDPAVTAGGNNLTRTRGRGRRDAS